MFLLVRIEDSVEDFFVFFKQRNIPSSTRMVKIEEHLCFLVLDLQVSYVVDIVGIIDLQWRTGAATSSAWICCSYTP